LRIRSSPVGVGQILVNVLFLAFGLFGQNYAVNYVHTGSKVMNMFVACYMNTCIWNQIPNLIFSLSVRRKVKFTFILHNLFLSAVIIFLLLN